MARPGRRCRRRSERAVLARRSANAPPKRCATPPPRSTGARRVAFEASRPRRHRAVRRARRTRERRRRRLRELGARSPPSLRGGVGVVDGGSARARRARRPLRPHLARRPPSRRESSRSPRSFESSAPKSNRRAYEPPPPSSRRPERKVANPAARAKPPPPRPRRRRGVVGSSPGSPRRRRLAPPPPVLAPRLTRLPPVAAVHPSHAKGGDGFVNALAQKPRSYPAPVPAQDDEAQFTADATAIMTRGADAPAHVREARPGLVGRGETLQDPNRRKAGSCPAPRRGRAPTREIRHVRRHGRADASPREKGRSAERLRHHRRLVSQNLRDVHLEHGGDDRRRPRGAHARRRARTPAGAPPAAEARVPAVERAAAVALDRRPARRRRRSACGWRRSLRAVGPMSAQYRLTRDPRAPRRRDRRTAVVARPPRAPGAPRWTWSRPIRRRGVRARRAATRASPFAPVARGRRFVMFSRPPRRGTSSRPRRLRRGRRRRRRRASAALPPRPRRPLSRFSPPRPRLSARRPTLPPSCLTLGTRGARGRRTRHRRSPGSGRRDDRTTPRAAAPRSSSRRRRGGGASAFARPPPPSPPPRGLSPPEPRWRTARRPAAEAAPIVSSPGTCSRWRVESSPHRPNEIILSSNRIKDQSHWVSGAICDKELQKIRRPAPHHATCRPQGTLPAPAAGPAP